MTASRDTVREVGLAEGVALARDGSGLIDVRELDPVAGDRHDPGAPRVADRRRH